MYGRVYRATISPTLEFDEPMTEQSFRAQFPVTERWAFLDHAAVAPLSLPAVMALRDYAENLAQNGIAAVKHWLDRIAARGGTHD